MLYQIASFLLDIVGGLLTGACLLRLYMQWQRIPFANPVGSLIFALTDWLVLPLRKAIRPLGRLDLSSLMGALAVQLVQYALLSLITGLGRLWVVWLPWLAILGLARVAISGLSGLIIVYAIMSWVPTRSALTDVIARLCDPLLRPLRRMVPLVGGIDLSPLVLLVLLQVALIVLGNLQTYVLQ